MSDSGYFRVNSPMRIIMSTDSDISAMSNATVIMRKPHTAKEIEYVGTLNGVNAVEVNVPASDVDVSGDYYLDAIITISGDDFRLGTAVERVKARFED